MNDGPKLQVLVGMIASGKSTYSKAAAKAGMICVNDDAIVNLLHADNYDLYDRDLKVLYKQIENTIVASALLLGKSVVVDRGLNVSRDGRQRWVSLAKSFDVPCDAVVLPRDTALVHAKRRFDSDSRGTSAEGWLRIARNHESVYEDPALSEGFRRVSYIPWESVSRGQIVE